MQHSLQLEHMIILITGYSFSVTDMVLSTLEVFSDFVLTRILWSRCYFSVSQSRLEAWQGVLSCPELYNCQVQAGRPRLQRCEVLSTEGPSQEDGSQAPSRVPPLTELPQLRHAAQYVQHILLRGVQRCLGHSPASTQLAFQENEEFITLFFHVTATRRWCWICLLLRCLRNK